ncbi:MAG: hypothetical protein QOK34_1692 [Gaiellaceae bacterium]|nr:hypothetical protein [Gaiellaceae bacterium]
MSSALRRTPPATTAAVVAVVASFVFLVAAWIAMPWVGGDTPFVLDGSNALLTCLSHHDLNACGYTGKLNFWGLETPIGYWPLLQHIPDVISIKLGATSHPARTRILTLLSVAGVTGSVVLARVVLSKARQSAWFWGFVFVVFSSPLIAYARTTVGEMLAAGLLVALVAATVLQAPPPLVAVAAFGACVTKETSYPFVIALGLLGLVLARRRTGRPIKAHLIGGAVGVAIAIVLASLLNIVRFGSILNTNYLHPDFRTPGIGRTLEYAVALLISPSGGIFVFWLSASVLAAALCVVPLLSRDQPQVDRRPALVLLVIAAGLVFGLAAWWTPFGWTSYGPRLSLPWLLPLVLMGLVAYGDLLAPLVARLLRPTWRLLAVFLVAFALTLPHIGEMWRPNSTTGFFAQVQNCKAPWNGGVQQWHTCQHELLWFHRPMPLYALHGLKTPGGLVTSFAVGLGLLGSLFLLRRGLVEPSAETARGRKRPPQPAPARA